MLDLALSPSALDGFPERDEIEAVILELPDFDPREDTGGFKFNWEVAAKWIWLWERTITHIEGPLAEQPYFLALHEKAIVANLFGWVDLKKNRRRFRDILYYVGQGNSKSTWAAGLITLVTAFDEEPGAQNIGTAATRDQADIIKRIVKGMIQNNDLLSKKMQVFSNNIVADDRFYRTISADANTAHGWNIYFNINDEVHAHARPDFLSVVRKKAQKRPNSVRVYISTSDFIREGSVSNTMYDRAKKVLSGEISVPSFLPAIYEVSAEDLEKDADCWKKEEYWRKANPLLGKAIELDSFRDACREAEETPALQNEFLRLCLNIRTESQSKMLNMDAWMNLCGGELNIEDYRGCEPVGVALDLGQTSDLTVMCVLYDLIGAPDDEHAYAAFWHHWTPLDTAEMRQRRDDGANYITWGRQGWIELTEGNETDYGGIRGSINELAPDLGIRSMKVDRLFQGAQLCQDLASDGFEIEEFGQGFMSMAAPTLEFNKLVSHGRFKHGNNPLMRWQAANTMAKHDAAGNMKPDKAKSGLKIDGIVTAIMALGMAMGREAPPTSWYEKHSESTFIGY